MASYLSYFTSNTSSQPYQQQQHQYGSAQTGGGSTWANTFSSRIATLRKALTKDNEEDDPDHEECSHVSNVLRAYYSEKGRPFPEWLPPDPKKPVVTAPPPVQNQYNQWGSGYGGNQFGAPQQDPRNSAGRGGLSDLWDSGPAQSSPQPQSLRAPRPTPQSLRSSDSLSRQSGGDPYLSQPTARPLPSQRSGSYQNSPAAAAATTPPVVGSRDRLRARLQGGGSGRNSPANTPSSYNDPAGQYGSNATYDPPYRARPGGPR